MTASCAEAVQFRMTLSELLDALDGLTHAARQKRLVDLGRLSTTDTSAKALLSELAGSDDAYARTLVVASLFGSRDGALALQLLTDRSRAVRQRALCAAAVVCSDAEAARALELCVTTKARDRLASMLRARKRVAPIDRFFEAKTEAMLSEDRKLVDALPLASEATVSRLIGAVERGGGMTTWARLVKGHARLFSRFIEGMIAKAQANAARQPLSGAGSSSALHTDWRLRSLLSTVARDLAERDSAAALSLLTLLLEGDGDPNSPTVRAMVPTLLRKRPRETFDLVRARHERRSAPVRPPGLLGMLRLDKAARHLGPERLAYVVEHAWQMLSDGKKSKRWFLSLSEVDRAAVIDAWLVHGRGGWGGFLFHHLPALDTKQRDAVYARWSTQAQSAEGTIPVHVLEWLPADLRQREARRHLGLAVLSTRADVRNTYAALLPFEEARRALTPFLSHFEGEERAKAVRVLIACVRHEPASMSAALALVRARKFEQDPVRLAMLDALSQLPVGCITPLQLDEVGPIIADALDAADLSVASATAAERLVLRLFRVDALWGAKWLTTILEKRGTIGATRSGELVDRLTPDDVRKLAPGLDELAQRWTKQERSIALLWLAQSLGLRLGLVPPLLDALEVIAREQRSSGVAAHALSLLRQHAPARFRSIVPELLAIDPSYAIVPDAAMFLSVYRQDLLGPFVSGQPMTGRFATGKTSWIIRFARGHGRWTPRLQAAHAAAWVELLRDEKRDIPTLIDAVGSLALLAFAPRDTLLPFASDPRPPVREKAVRALPWLDQGQGVPTLIEALGDDRARWAIYALRRAFAEMSRERVLGHLRAAPIHKVTVAKEVMRLLGELGGREAFEVLLGIDTRDLEAAREEEAARLEASKAGMNAKGAERLTKRVARLHRDVRIALLRALWDHVEREEAWPIFERAVSHPDWVVASKLADIPLDRLSSASQDRVVDLLVRILGRPEPEARLDLLRRAAQLPLSDTKRVLLRALVERLGATRPDEAVAAAQAVRSRMLAGEVELVMVRLRELEPRRELMLHLLPGFAPNAYSPQHLRSLAESILAMLARDPLATIHYLRFAGSVLDWKGLCTALEDLAKRDFLHADAMLVAYDMIAKSTHPALIEARFAGHANPRLRRLAVEALKHAAAPSNGWSKVLRAMLTRYQTDPAPLVAAAAAYVFPPE